MEPEPLNATEIRSQFEQLWDAISALRDSLGDAIDRLTQKEQ